MYQPSVVPAGIFSPAGAEFLQQELRRIAQADAFLRLTPTKAEPTKPRDGDIVFVDGTAWVPAGGSGAGYYGYRALAWRFLG